MPTKIWILLQPQNVPEKKQEKGSWILRIQIKYVPPWLKKKQIDLDKLPFQICISYNLDKDGV